MTYIVSSGTLNPTIPDGWAVTFGTARRGLAGPHPTQASPRCTKCKINGQCTNIVLFNVAQ